MGEVSTRIAMQSIPDRFCSPPTVLAWWEKSKNLCLHNQTWIGSNTSKSDRTQRDAMNQSQTMRRERDATLRWAYANQTRRKMQIKRRRRLLKRKTQRKIPRKEDVGRVTPKS